MTGWLKRIHLLYAINLLAAFLLFQIELIISKIFLPKFGGSYLVWGACVVFFQCVLLLGYLYSHIVVKKFGIFRYRAFQVFLILLPFLSFPGRPLQVVGAHSNLALVFDIFLQLMSSIGTVFFALSTISIVSQSWLAASELPESGNPYVLYSVSNIGSFLGLLSYPFIFEYYLDINQQLNIWRISYLLFFLLYLAAFKWIKINKVAAPVHKTVAKSIFSISSVPLQDKVRWFILSAASVILFLSATNVITYEVAPCPLLWIAPLAIYLVSFVLNFQDKPICPVWIREKGHLVLGLSCVLFFLTQARIFPFAIVVILYLLSLFALCMFCQYEIYRSRPQERLELTGFYWIISLGSFIGGILVSWGAPFIFSSTTEYLLGLFITSLALAIGQKREAIGFYRLRLIIYLITIIIIWPFVFRGYNIFGIIILCLVFKFAFSELKVKPRSVSLALLSFLLIAHFVHAKWSGFEDEIYAHRNYYGIYRLVRNAGTLTMFNGTTIHGVQYLDAKRKDETTSYYHSKSPVGRLFESKIFNFKRIGIVGLGCGTLAAYGQNGQFIDFFELDPDVYTMASSFFSFLKDSRARISCYIGDARISLKSADDNAYDILIIDAFSGDSIPVHLLTTEAIKEYKRCLAKDGIILFHISNRYIDLVPVLASNAREAGAYFLSAYNRGIDPAKLGSIWTALTWDKGYDAVMRDVVWKGMKDEKSRIKKIRPWTDTYSDMLVVFKAQEIKNSIKSFNLLRW